MTPAGPDPGQEAGREATSILTMRVALVLLAEGRRRGDFGDEEELAARAAELVEEIGGGAPSSPPERPLIEVDLNQPDRIGLAANFSESGADVAGLGFDGILYDEGTVMGISAAQTEPVELSEEEQAELERLAAGWQEQAERQERFTGSRFLRALAAPPQPDASTRILAVMLFADGLSVEHTWDEEPREAEEIDSAAGFFGARGGRRIRVEDDLGTEYLEGNGGWGGVQVSRGRTSFTPAVPAAARVLRIVTDEGTVELDL